METRAPFIIVGAFILAAVCAIFGFVFWLHNTGSIGARTSYNIQFNGPVPGLLVGAAVLFNGIRVGEVTNLHLAADDPRRVNATIAVEPDTPVRANTKVGLDFQGLTGVPVIALEGGALTSQRPTGPLIAEPGAGESMTQAARDALRKVDTILSDNADPLQSTIANLKTFSDGLARNTSKLDGVMAGLDRMFGGGASAAQKVVYDLAIAPKPDTTNRAIKGQLVIPDPSAIVLFDTQRFLVMPPGTDPGGLANAQWGDSIPKLIQAKLIQSFENYNVVPSPLRGMDNGTADYQLLLEIRSFQIDTTAAPEVHIALSAKIVNKDGRAIAARVFEEAKPLPAGLDPLPTVNVFGVVFDAVAVDIIRWTLTAIG